MTLENVFAGWLVLVDSNWGLCLNRHFFPRIITGQNILGLKRGEL